MNEDKTENKQDWYSPLEGEVVSEGSKIRIDGTFEDTAESTFVVIHGKVDVEVAEPLIRRIVIFKDLVLETRRRTASAYVGYYDSSEGVFSLNGEDFAVDDVYSYSGAVLLSEVPGTPGQHTTRWS